MASKVIRGHISIRLADDFDLTATDTLLDEFAHAPLEAVEASKPCSREVGVLHKLHAWHAAIQRGANVPVFGGCRLWERGRDAEGVRRVQFAVPSFAASASIATLRFVCETTSALAGPNAEADVVRTAARQRFKRLWPVLEANAVASFNTKYFLGAAHRLGVEHQPSIAGLWLFGLGRHRKLLNSSISSSESHLGVGIARNKLACCRLLRTAGLPVPVNDKAATADVAVELARQIGYPVVLKPSDCDGGKGVTAGIDDDADLRRAFRVAAAVSPNVMIEKHHDGSDYRVTVLKGRAIKVMLRRAAGVVGDGRHTVAQLVDQFNEATKGIVLRKQRPPLTIDDEATTLLRRGGYTAHTVLPEGVYVALRRRANISAGGTFDVVPPEAIHPDNRRLAENAASALSLELAGVDLITGDPGKSWHETGGIICEVNASPQIGLRDSPTIYGDILTALLDGDGSIPVHLLIARSGCALPGSMPGLAAKRGCDGAAWGANGWIGQGGMLRAFADVFEASRSVLSNPSVTAALIAMTEKEVLQFGLPIRRFASITVDGEGDWKQGELGRLLDGHCPTVAYGALPR